MDVEIAGTVEIIFLLYCTFFNKLSDTFGFLSLSMVF